MVVAQAKKSGPSRSWWQRLWGLSNEFAVRVYHGYGDEDGMLIFGHVMSQSPEDADYFKRGILKNAGDLFRLFMVRTVANAPVRLHFEGESIDAEADDTGFFTFEWKKERKLSAGWHDLTVEVIDGPAAGTVGKGKLYHPHPTKRAFISDIDDTFLVSHSANLALRLKTLLTKNPQTRRTFEGVVDHYVALAKAHTSPEVPNPFFYVSSSEWNLYGYIKEFCRLHGLPEGVFLLSPIKGLTTFWKSGQGKHATKYDRIERIINEYAETSFVLLGDDTQQDPDIYAKLVATFPAQIGAVYLRHRVREHKGRVDGLVKQMEAAGIPVCYFRHSKEALEHSRRIGLA
jgi:phosphatidate phosphatase APP1